MYVGENTPVENVGRSVNGGQGHCPRITGSERQAIFLEVDVTFEEFHLRYYIHLMAD